MRSLTMATFHDLAEARTGDLDFVNKHYSVADEEKAVKDQFNGFEFGKDLKKLVEEYEERKSLESKCAKDADSLEQMYQEWVLMWQGNKLAKKWFEGSNPQEWWWSQFVRNDMAIDREKLLGKA